MTVEYGKLGTWGLEIPVVHTKYGIVVQDPTGSEVARHEGREIQVHNPSREQKLWDIDIRVTRPLGVTELDRTVRTLNPGEVYSEILPSPPGDHAPPHLQYPTIDESVAVEENDQGQVVLRITVTFAGGLADRCFRLVKWLPGDPAAWNTVKSRLTGHGNAVITGNWLSWQFEDLAPQGEGEAATFECVVPSTGDLESLRRDCQGNFILHFAAPLEEDSMVQFEAYCDNFLGIEESEQDESPGFYDCRLRFENRSDYWVKVIAVDVTDEDGNQVLSLGGGQVPLIPAQARLESNSWVSDAGDLEPIF